MLYFVGYNSRLGYVKETDLYPFTVPNHPNELSFLTPEQPSNNPQPAPEQNNDFFSLKAIIVLCLIFAGIIALFIALKVKPEKNVAISYYDENDYE
jgi:hypothetical protein